jgi:hypothetical protein
MPGTRNAVSDRFISAATWRIQPSSAGTGNRTTAAGFPAKGSGVNASTCRKGNRIVKSYRTSRHWPG